MPVLKDTLKEKDKKALYKAKGPDVKEIALLGIVNIHSKKRVLIQVLQYNSGPKVLQFTIQYLEDEGKEWKNSKNTGLPKKVVEAFFNLQMYERALKVM